MTAGPTHWVGWLERLLLLFPVVVGAGVVGALAGAPVPVVQRAVLAAVGLAAVGIRVGIPACLLLDARALGREGGSWTPSRLLDPAAALLISAPLVGLFYLYRRYEHGYRPAGSGHWWVAVALSAVLAPVAAVVGIVGTAAAIGTVLAVAATVAAGLLPVGIYRDAAHVRGAEDGWNPNPALYLAVAFLCLAVAVLQPVLSAWYLGKRYRVRQAASP